MDIKQVSTNSLIVYFGDTISSKISSKVITTYNNIKNKNYNGIIELIPSYTSIFISYDIFKYNFIDLKDILLNLKNCKDSVDLEDDIVNIDVYYGVEVGLDLENISLKVKLTIDDIIAIHSNKIYDVYAMGFLPGFGFLASVDKRIATPRLQTPRKKILKGSVAIANTQTAVYPSNSAGGWNIIGRTTKKLFDKSINNLSHLSVGKKVKFNPITKNEFLNQGGKI